METPASRIANRITCIGGARTSAAEAEGSWCLGNGFAGKSFWLDCAKLLSVLAFYSLFMS